MSAQGWLGTKLAVHPGTKCRHHQVDYIDIATKASRKAMRLRNENKYTSGFILPNQRVRVCLPFVWEKTPHLASAAMANEPIDSTAPSASNNNIALAPNTTNPAPTPNKSLSPPSKEEKEKLNKPLKKSTATLSPPLGQFKSVSPPSKEEEENWIGVWRKQRQLLPLLSVSSSSPQYCRLLHSLPQSRSVSLL